MFRAFTMLLFCAAVVHADTVTLKNGDKLTGEIVALRDGKLTFSTAAMGNVQIDTAEIASLESDNDMSVKLAGQDAKIGRFAAQNNASNLVGNDPVNAVAADQIEAIDTIQSLQEGLKDQSQVFSGSIDVGITSSSGNTDTDSFFVRGTAALNEVMVGGFKDPLAIKGDFLYKKESDVLTARRGQLEGRYDSFFRERTSVFFLERVSFAEFSDLDLRVEEQLGMSQVLISQPRYSVSADAGVTRIDSFFETAPNEGEFGLVFGGHLAWRIIGELSLTEDVEYKPAFEDFSDYLFKSETGLTTKLSEHWKVALIYQLDYDNKPPAGVSGTDRNLVLTFGYSF